MKNALLFGIPTAVVIIISLLMEQAVVYSYIRFDIYLAIIAVAFLLLGLYINKNQQTVLATASQTSQNILQLLTTRELQIFKMLADGKTNKEIAALSFVELSTVKTHINNIYGKLQVTNRKDARAKYAEIVDKITIP